jgi:hypothetical protein
MSTTSPSPVPRLVTRPAFVAWRRNGRGVWEVAAVGESVAAIVENFGGSEVILPFGRRPPEESKRA